MIALSAVLAYLVAGGLVFSVMKENSLLDAGRDDPVAACMISMFWPISLTVGAGMAVGWLSAKATSATILAFRARRRLPAAKVVSE